MRGSECLAGTHQTLEEALVAWLWRSRFRGKSRGSNRLLRLQYCLTLQGALAESPEKFFLVAADPRILITKIGELLQNLAWVLLVLCLKLGMHIF